MKQVTFLLILILMSCKGETKTELKTENGIDQSIYDMWQDFIISNLEFQKEELPESWFFHDNKEDANRLAELTLCGKKKASSGLYAWYEAVDADLPKIVTKHIITDFEGKAKAIIELKK